MKMRKREIIAVLLLACTVGALACTSAIVSGRLTANGRPLMWKNRDTSDMNNRVKRIEAHDSCYAFVGLFDARDKRDTAAWMGYNEKGFAIMNTASYNLNHDTVPERDMDREGVVMKLALERCATVGDFERLLQSLPKPLGVEANFGVIDAQGNGAYFETGNFAYTKYDLADAPDGILMRTNYSMSGRPNDGMGYVRYENEKTLLAPHIARRDFTPAVFTEQLSRSFYHSLLGRDFTHDTSVTWLVDQDFIPRRISTATTVIESVLPGENPLLTTMWIGLGYPPCAEVMPVWLWEGGVPASLQGQGPKNHAPQCDLVNARKDSVFSIARGNGKHYLDLRMLYNAAGTGYCQVLTPRNMQAYQAGYAELAKRRAQYAKQAATAKKNHRKKK